MACCPTEHTYTCCSAAPPQGRMRHSPDRLNNVLMVAGTEVSSNSELLNGPVGRWMTVPFAIQGLMIIAVARAPVRRKSKCLVQVDSMVHAELSAGIPTGVGTWSKYLHGLVIKRVMSMGGGAGAVVTWMANGAGRSATPLPSS